MIALFRTLSQHEVVAKQLREAQHDLLEVQHSLEYYTAIELMLRARVARLADTLITLPDGKAFR